MIPSGASRNTPRVLLVCDAGPAVGGGHVMRCLTLAGALAANGAEVAFRDGPEVAAVLDAFAPPGIGRSSVGQGGFDVVVVDHYRLSLAEEGALARSGAHLVALEDLGRPHPAADLVIDPGALDGPGYQLVRPEFAALRDVALSRRGGAAERVLVSLGLTDVGGVTGRVVEALLPAADDLLFDVVVGAGATSFVALQALADQGRIGLHVQTPHMAELIAEADIAIGAGGSSLWERACLGLPAVTLVLADNQRDLSMKLDEAGATLAIDARWPGFETRLVAAFHRLVADDALRLAVTQLSSQLCDGRGAGRAAGRILALL